MRRILVAGLVLLAVAGCGSSGSGSSITVGAARTYQLTGFQPAAQVQPGLTTTVAFTITQPDGKPLTAYRRGSGPHTGIHLIIVKDDLSTIIHQHPPVGPDGRLSASVVFPSPGRYRVVVDAYPQRMPSGQLNFQLFRWITVAGQATAQPVPPLRRTPTVDGYRIALQGNPKLRAIEPAFLTFTITDPQGRPARFTPWFGALAHAIFFRAGSLDYFHTHVCSPGASGCTSVLGAARVTGSSTTPGQLKVGVLVPVSGTWRLFLQCQVANGLILTVPFTLHVR